MKDETNIIIIELIGIPLERLRELIQLFNEAGYNIREEKDFEEVKMKIQAGCL